MNSICPHTVCVIPCTVATISAVAVLKPRGSSYDRPDEGVCVCVCVCGREKLNKKRQDLK